MGSVIHLEPIVFTCRVFLKGKRWGDPYDGVCTVQKMGSLGFISGYHGKLDKKAVMDLSDELEKFGITELKWLKNGRMK